MGLTTLQKQSGAQRSVKQKKRVHEVLSRVHVDKESHGVRPSQGFVFF